MKQLSTSLAGGFHLTEYDAIELVMASDAIHPDILAVELFRDTGRSIASCRNLAHTVLSATYRGEKLFAQIPGSERYLPTQAAFHYYADGRLAEQDLFMRMTLQR